ncbi:hypothetical protein [Haloarcula ordinaria]|uniref:hypothetical protein n=1 Tax=Haloarcula ordinaria TaxID=3033390 RepID=UPI0023E867FA|nr:hypothetical protein [Halomicroarcula sp. ZS-22-S1]
MGTGGGVAPAAQVEFETKGSGAVQELVIVERVDRDGDGYASGFRLKVVSDTRPKDPKENGQAGRSTAKLFSVLIGGPFKKLHNFFTKEASDEFFAPGQVVRAVTADGTRDVVTYRPIGPKKYLGPGEEADETPLFVGTAREGRRGHTRVTPSECRSFSDQTRSERPSNQSRSKPAGIQKREDH